MLPFRHQECVDEKVLYQLLQKGQKADYNEKKMIYYSNSCDVPPESKRSQIVMWEMITLDRALKL